MTGCQVGIKGISARSNDVVDSYIKFDERVRTLGQIHYLPFFIPVIVVNKWLVNSLSSVSTFGVLPVRVQALRSFQVGVQLILERY